MIAKLLKTLKPERQDVQHAVTAVTESLIGRLAKQVLPYGIKSPSLDKVGSKKLAKSGGLVATAVLVVNLLVNHPWYPQAWTDPTSISTVTGAVAWTLNLLRKLLVRYAPTAFVGEVRGQ